MPSFIEVLRDLNAQNFGGGLTKYGESIKGTIQNKALLEGIEKFQNEKQIFEGDDDVKTTEESLAELNKVADNIDTGKYNKTTDKAATATKHMLDILQKMNGVEDLYRPFITSFAMLGEDGVRAANSLARDLGSQKELLSQRMKLPIQHMEYLSEAANLELNSIKLEELKTTIEDNKEISSVIDYMMSDSNILGMSPGEHLIYNNPAKIQEVKELRNRVIRNAKQKFGNIDGNLLLKAYQGALANYGINYKFVDKPDKYSGTGTVDAKAISDAAVNNRAYTILWENMNDEGKGDIQRYIKGEIDQIAEYKSKEQWLNNMVKIFGPGGYFMNNHRVLQNDTGYRDFEAVNALESEVMQKHIEKMSDEQKAEWETRKKTLSGSDKTNIRVYKGYNDILRPWGENAFITNSFEMSPKGNQDIINEITRAADDAKNFNMFTPQGPLESIDLMDIMWNGMQGGDIDKSINDFLFKKKGK